MSDDERISIITQHMIESNAIEGETGLNPDDVEAAQAFLTEPISQGSLLACHATLAKHLDVDWGGRYRCCEVYVGEHTFPGWMRVPMLMAHFFDALPRLSAWEAHCRFENIHPFQDLNGRTGRLIWLHKMLKIGDRAKLPFLQRFYYQTLSAYRVNI